jgi:hypothetical protein
MKRFLMYTAMVAVCALALGILYVQSRVQPDSGVNLLGKSVELAGQTVTVSVADTPALREQGLSGRTSLAENEGMLFVFDEDGMYTFWMKDMLIPIDIVWLDEDGTVVTVAPQVSPGSFPEVFSPTRLARYALELPAGWTSAHFVSVGDKIRLQR